MATVGRSAERIYRFIIRYKRLHLGDSPSRDEIGAGTMMTKSYVNDCLKQLVTAGLIKLPAFNRSRAIQIPGSRWSFDETVEQARDLPPLGGDSGRD